MEISSISHQKVAIITGASSGIGKALAIQLAKQGYNLMLGARNISELEIVCSQCEGFSIICKIQETDVSVEEDCKKLIETTISNFGRIDVLINNAGISMRSFFAETNLSVIKQVMDVNFWGTVYCTHFAIREIIKSKGSIVSISSIAGFVGLPGRTGYSASKFAINGFMEALEIENKETGIHVMVAAPGFVSTNIRNTALTMDGSVQKESPRDESKMATPELVAEQIWEGIQKRKSLLIMDTQGWLTTTIKKIAPQFAKSQVFKHISKEEGAPFTKEYLKRKGFI